MVTIKKIALENLDTFMKSDEFLSFENKPISELRASSYLQNPNANFTDTVLYLGFIKNELISYKSVFADTFKIDERSIRFGWLSGTWTHQDYRRKGISSILFYEVLKDWNGRLMYTNYAIESKAVYDKTNKFQLLNFVEGYRHYIRFSFKELLPPKAIVFKKSKGLLNILDILLNAIFDLRFKFLKLKKTDLYKFVKFEKWTDDIEKFIKPFKQNELFQRNQIIYEWIDKYPWIKTDNYTKEKTKKYYFSSFANKFKSDWYKIYDLKTGEIVGVVLINIRDKELKIPYIYAFPEITDILKNEILNLCISQKINYLTIYNQQLNGSILKQKYYKLKSKKFIQNYFVTKELLEEFPEIKNNEIQSGDGDVVFT